MGEIIGVGLVSHVPTIMLPEQTRRALNNGQDSSLVSGFKRLREEVLDALQPDTIIVFDTHSASLLEFVIPTHSRRSGKFTSEELPRGMSQIPYDLKGSPVLAAQIAEQITAHGTKATPIDDPYLPIHYGTVNVAHYLNAGEEWLSIGICMTAQTEDFLSAGKGIGTAIRESNKKVVLLASGSMSHSFYPMKELHKYEASDPALIFTPEARAADMKRLEWFHQGNHADVIDTMEGYMQYKPEGRFGHYLMMVAAVGGRQCRAKGRLFSDYENSIGTSQVHVWFDKPELGWT